MNVNCILTDIEGTTTAIDFVHRTLFPYSKARIRSHILEHSDLPEMQAALRSVRETLENESLIKNPNLEQCLAALEQWIDQDRKHPGLKAIQGYIWEAGYVQGDYKGHVYSDVKPCLQHWQNLGIRLAVYSSGSVKAQKLIFGYSCDGDLSSYFESFFDTGVGPKREASSYQKILDALNVSKPDTVCFLSDVIEELKAAHACGIRCIQLIRAENEIAASPSESRFPSVSDFFAVGSLLGIKPRD